MKRILAITLVAFFLLLAGCENVSYDVSKNPSGESSPEESSKNIYEDLASNLPTLSVEPPIPSEDNSDNHESNTDEPIVTLPAETPFTIITDEITAFYQDEENPSIVGSAIQERNAFLKEKYGAVITVKEMSGDTLLNELKNAVASGVDFCDMLAVSAADSAILYKNGLLEDLNTLPDFNAESEYFDQSNATKLATNSTLYLLPDPTAMVYEDLNVMFYNRDLLILPEGYESPESLVLQGKWTWDRFNEIARASASAVYDKVAADLAGDTFAFTAYADDNTFPLAMFASSGERVVDNTYKHAVEISIEYDVAESVCDKMVSIYDTNGRYPFDGNTALEAFEENRTVFFFNTFDYFYALRDGSAEESKYGFLPMPKMSDEQSGYHCLASDSARVISVPKTLQNADASRRRFVSAVISATCALGGPTVREAFINSQIVLYLYNNTETLVLETICDSIFFDFSYIIGNLYYDIADCSTNAINEHITVGNSISESFRRRKYYFDQDSVVIFQ